MQKIYLSIKNNIGYIKEKIRSDDLKLYEFRLGDKLKTKAAIFFIDSMADKKSVAQDVLKPLKDFNEKITASVILNAVNSPAAEIFKSFTEATKKILEGDTVLFVDGINSAFCLSFLNIEKRPVTEPPTSITLRGPREGFVENINSNLSLIRRRLKTPKLEIETFTVGKLSATQVAVISVKGVTKEGLYDKVKARINAIDIDSVPDSSYVAKFLTEHKTSLFKQVGTTEKPDILVARILEGRIAVVVDGSPFVLTLPYVLAEDFQSADDYYSSSYRASMIRILRVGSVFAAIMLPAFFVASQLFHLQFLPLSFLLTIVNSIKGIPLSPSFEMFFTLMIFEILNEASIRMPKYVGMAVSIVGGLVLGETAVNAGIISAPALMIIAISGICLYTVPELVQTFSILRLLFLCVAGSVGGYGLILLSVAVLAYLVSFETYDTPLMAPFAPLITSDLSDTLYKGFMEENIYRPATFGSKNSRRMKILSPTDKSTDINGEENDD